jgi:hypothetical protein
MAADSFFALVLCRYPIPGGLREAYNQCLAALEPKQVAQNAGKTSLEFGTLASPILFRFLDWIPSAIGHIQVNKDELAHHITPQLMSAPRKKPFFELIRSGMLIYLCQFVLL